MNIYSKSNWKIKESLATPEDVYLKRRDFVKYTLSSFLLGSSSISNASAQSEKNDSDLIGNEDRFNDISRNDRYRLDRPLTKKRIAARYNNFFEFGPTKNIAWLAQRLKVRPWQVLVDGLEKKKILFDIDRLIDLMSLEERLYRFRCVEAWAMAVPWIGFPLSDFVKKVVPSSRAKYVVFTTFLNRKIALGQLQTWYSWPYVECLTIQEAMNELSFLAIGIYGKSLPKQHGAPIRLVVPWKYGFKSIKSIVSIDFVEKRPKTFWETAQPNEYGFWANINPNFDHPRWSQKTERMLGTNQQRKTEIFNGYSELVSHMYPRLKDRTYFF